MGGKNTDVYKLKNMFRTIYYGMHKRVNEGTTLQHILEISKIILWPFQSHYPIDKVLFMFLIVSDDTYLLLFI